MVQRVRERVKKECEEGKITLPRVGRHRTFLNKEGKGKERREENVWFRT